VLDRPVLPRRVQRLQNNDQGVLFTRPQQVLLRAALSAKPPVSSVEKSFKRIFFPGDTKNGL
jgi:hypothetical protein